MTTSNVIGRDAILGAKDANIVFVDVPEWGGSVGIREMTAATRDRFEASITVEIAGKRVMNRDNVRARLIILTACDAEGNLLFTDADVETIGNKSVGAIDRLFNAAAKLNGLGKDAVDNAEKNSVTTQSEDSISA